MTIPADLIERVAERMGWNGSASMGRAIGLTTRLPAWSKSPNADGTLSDGELTPAGVLAMVERMLPLFTITWADGFYWVQDEETFRADTLAECCALAVLALPEGT